MNNMTCIELAWVAGLIEGEGTFGAYKTNVKGGTYKQFSVAVQMTDLDVLQKLHRITGLGTVIEAKRTKKENHKTCYVWKIGSRPEAKQFMQELLPLMGERRSARITELLEELDEYESRLDGRFAGVTGTRSDK